MMKTRKIKPQAPMAEPSLNGKAHTGEVTTGQDVFPASITPLELAKLAALIDPASPVFADYEDMACLPACFCLPPASKTEDVLRKAVHLYYIAAREAELLGKLSALDIAVRYRCGHHIEKVMEVARAAKESTAFWHFPSIPAPPDAKPKKAYVNGGYIDSLRQRLDAAGVPCRDTSNELLRQLWPRDNGTDDADFEKWKSTRRRTHEGVEYFVIYEEEIQQHCDRWIKTDRRNKAKRAKNFRDKARVEQRQLEANVAKLRKKNKDF